MLLRAALISLIIFLGSSSLFGAEQREDGTWEFFTELKTANGVPATVRIITGPWEASEHVVEELVNEKWVPVIYEIVSREKGGEGHQSRKFRIDGNEYIHGMDGFGWPSREVKLFVVQWGDRTINIPKKYTRDFYALLLFTVEETLADLDKGGCWTKAEYVAASNQIHVTANGGGGAGWYVVKWKISPSGEIQVSEVDEEH